MRETDSITALAAAGGAALAGSAAGLFRRHDEGDWQRLDLAATEIQAIAVGDKAEVVAAGAGSAVDVSHDGGVTWERGELETAGRVTALGLAGSTLLAGTDRDGAFVSLNGGKSWTPSGLQGQMVLAVCGDKLAGTDEGLWLREAATKWRKLGLDAVVTALARAGKAIVAGTEDQGLFRSTDEGSTWQKAPSVEEGINAIAASGQRLVAGTSVGRLYESVDGGATWSELPALPTAVMSLAIDSDRVLAGAYRTGLFELVGGQWQPANSGMESTNAIDLLWTSDGLLVVAMDGLRRLRDGQWQVADSPAPGDPRAASLGKDGKLLLGTNEGLFAGGKRIGELADVTLIRTAPNGDLAVLTEDALHLRLGEKWTQVPRAERERTIDVVFSPSYPDDDGLLLLTLRQGTRTSVVRYGPKSQEVDRIFDYDARSRWLSVALPPDYAVDTRRPARFFAGTGGSLFRPAWPGDHWERDILHDPNAIVLSVALSPKFGEDRSVAVGTTAGAVMTQNGGLLWMTMDEGLEDRRCLKMVYSPDRRLYCLTPTRVYELADA
ncbi:MAG: WD40/YVTN/BNR-like repeat-containing protein [Chloroflexota bacterium]